MDRARWRCMPSGRLHCRHGSALGCRTNEHDRFRLQPTQRRANRLDQPYYQNHVGNAGYFAAAYGCVAFFIFRLRLLTMLAAFDGSLHMSKSYVYKPPYNCGTLTASMCRRGGRKPKRASAARHDLELWCWLAIPCHLHVHLQLSHR